MAEVLTEPSRNWEEFLANRVKWLVEVGGILTWYERRARVLEVRRIAYDASSMGLLSPDAAGKIMYEADRFRESEEGE